MGVLGGTTPPIVSILLVLLTAYCLNLSRLADINFMRPALSSSVRHVPVSSHRRVEFVPGGRIRWCSGQSEVKELCNIQNLCYSHHYKEYFIFDGGAFENETRKTVVDLTSQPGTKISLKVSGVPISFGEREEHSYKIYYDGKFILFYPFVANNIFHTLHDDVLPLYATLSKHGDLPNGEPNRTIILNRSLNKIQRDFLDIYQLFSRNRIQSCFEDVTVGLSKETVWYQHGFTVPEGPTPRTGLTPAHVGNFTSFFKERLGIHGICRPKERYGVLLSRKHTRLILNEEELGRGISKELGVAVETLSMKQNTTKEIMETAACARFMIGVHGSMLIFSMFLPPPENDSSRPFLLELYPFALRPDGYTHYRTLSALSGLDVEYHAWRNVDRSRTVTHAWSERPEARHLTGEERARINMSADVPPHLCCDDPAFRFRLNQDTVVDVRAVLDIIGNVSLARNCGGGGGGCE